MCILKFLRRSILSTDWCRFDFHAKRVRSLGLPHRPSVTHNITSDSEVWRVLRISRPLAQLCPSLRHLSWCSLVYHDTLPLEHVLSLVGPQICRLLLEFKASDLAEISSIRSIPVICPRITHLSMYFYYHNDLPEESGHFREIVCEIVCCYQLVDFSFNISVSQRALLHLAGMPALQKLSLDVSSNDNLISLSLPQCAFPALRDLHLTGKMASAFLEVLPSCKLEAIRVQFKPTTNEGDIMARFFQVLHERCSHQSLSRIGVYFGPNVIHLHYPDIEGYMLQPLLSFVNLQDITISIHHMFRIDNDFVEAAAKSWPRLRSLNLGIGWGNDRWGGRSNITLTGLASLARHCPDLTSLAIVIDATVVDHVLDTPVSNTKLNALNLGDSIIQNPTSVAAYLSRIFPYLTSVYSWQFSVIQAEQERRKKYRDRWDEVARLIKISADVYKMERNKMDGCRNEVEL
jgi:hypothetical protein